MTQPITAEVLANAPELATLEALEKLLSLAEQALVAEHPTLGQQRWPCELRAEPITLRQARCILRRIAPLLAVLVRYRRAVLDTLSPRIADEAAVLPF